MTPLAGQQQHEFVHRRFLLQDVSVTDINMAKIHWWLLQVPNFNVSIGKREDVDNNENIIIDHERDESDMQGPIDRE